ncbi:uncharacterized protein EAF02_000059 [Botrytis sinoallii]|uniref:uncharacterized protein n=1 Tax=Botrytis sinoallii TaxID=1463999 RepID=UPI0019001CBF|nr:uncharacterized protein EAF02_000059 [Botrytis sinoallii]KAF7892521.1 hypothetical protein EAF02_000059 [Botrytis sinoallii]
MAIDAWRHLHPAEHALPFNSDSDRNSNLNIISLLHATSPSVKQAQKISLAARNTCEPHTHFQAMYKSPALSLVNKNFQAWPPNQHQR